MDWTHFWQSNSVIHSRKIIWSLCINSLSFLDLLIVSDGFLNNRLMRTEVTDIFAFWRILFLLHFLALVIIPFF